jgi:hypothetical protein
MAKSNSSKCGIALLYLLMELGIFGNVMITSLCLISLTRRIVDLYTLRQRYATGDCSIANRGGGHPCNTRESKSILPSIKFSSSIFRENKFEDCFVHGFSACGIQPFPKTCIAVEVTYFAESSKFRTLAAMQPASTPRLDDVRCNQSRNAERAAPTKGMYFQQHEFPGTHTLLSQQSKKNCKCMQLNKFTLILRTT